MINILLIAVLLAIVGLAIRALVKAKRSGRHCIGCPDGGCCSAGQNEGCGCGCGADHP